MKSTETTVQHTSADIRHINKDFTTVLTMEVSLECHIISVNLIEEKLFVNRNNVILKT